MQRILYILLLLYCGPLVSQSFLPSVYNADGGTGTIIAGTDTFRIYYNIGEPIIDDIQNGQVRLTQGFLQPDMVAYGDTIQVNAYTTVITCHDANDASITLNASGLFPPFHYSWYKNGLLFSDTLSSVTGLGSGSYVFIVADAHGHTKTDTILFENSNQVCSLTIHNGFTPNGDGINDVFQVDNIENFPDNTVSIFNRWGNVVWEEKGYNNTSVAWHGQSQQGQTLSAGTYFFIIDVSGKKTKGWVELMR